MGPLPSSAAALGAARLVRTPPWRALLVVLAIALAAEALPGQEAGVPTRSEPARFTDPGRASKLATRFAEIDRVFREFTTREHIPGAAWGIIVDGALAHVGVTGYRDVASRAPVDSNTVFRIASMTKSFTALAILGLRDEGKLSLDDPAERYVPELKTLAYPTTDSPRITIRYLLSHAAGFPEDNPWGDQQLAVTDEEFTRMLQRGIPFSNAPGIAYEYSNYAFAILGRVVTRVSGVPYAEYVSANILRPLRMSSTTLQAASVAHDRLAQGYRWEDDRWKIEPQLPDGAFGAMGGMLTSPHDLSTWVATFLSAWPPRDGPEAAPLRRSSLREMQQVWRPSPPSVGRDATGALELNAGGYAFGLSSSSNCLFGHIVQHSGGLPGFGSRMTWLPEYGVGIIALGNRTYTNWRVPFDEAFRLLAATGALQPRIPQPSTALINARAAVSRLIARWDDALADTLAAANLFLDRSRERRRSEIDAVHTQMGACRAGDGFDVVENALRGQWLMPCERGAVRVSITLAPTMPPLVQFLEVAPELRPREQSRGKICRQ